MPVPTLADLRQRFHDGIISQEQYNLEEKAIMADMASGARARRGAFKMKTRGTFAEVEAEETALAIKYSTPIRPESSLLMHYDATFDERDEQARVDKEREADRKQGKRHLRSRQEQAGPLPLPPYPAVTPAAFSLRQLSKLPLAHGQWRDQVSLRARPDVVGTLPMQTRTGSTSGRSR